MGTTVRTLLQQKGGDICSIKSRATVFEALEMMAAKNIGALLVVDAGKLAGIFSERDYARKVFLHGKSSKEVAVADIMTADVLYVTQETTIDDCMALMTNKRVRHLPVLENDSLIGLVSIGDVVKKIISDQEFTIQQLEKYITS